ncbi:IS110 family RNA-guided transposase [Tessaracoccus sp. G1721]
MSSVKNLRELVDLVIGVDTHEQFHVAAAVDAVTGGVLDTIKTPADPAGYQQLIDWAHTRPGRRGWAIEGTNSHGIGLTRALAGELVVEVDRPERIKRRNGAKSDSIDAVRAARDALGRDSLSTPRAVTGDRAALQVLVTSRHLTITQATDTERQLRSMVLTAPDELRSRFTGRKTAPMVTQALKLRPHTNDDPLTGILMPVLKELAQRARSLRLYAMALQRQILDIVRKWRPDLLDLNGVGPIVAASLLLVWSHPGRVHSEAAFAMLSGTAPIPATSGTQQTRHRLNRSGDRHLNQAIHTIILCRQRNDPATKAYIERRTAEGRTKREIRRCLKRYVARQTFRILEKGVDKT